MKIISAPPLTRAVTLTLFLLSAAVFYLRYSVYLGASASSGDGETQVDIQNIYVPYIVLVPNFFLKFPWTLMTSSFVEHNIFSFLLAGAALFFCCRYVERIWGSKELAKFLAIQTIIPTIVNLLLAVFLAGFLGNAERYMLTRISGSVAIQTGFLVALKQLIPEHSIVLLSGAFKVQFKFLVIPCVVLYTIVGIANSWTIAVSAWIGLITAWVYLRFIKVVYIETLPTSLTEGVSQQEIKGDASDTFAFAKFFYPQPISDLVASLCHVIYNLLVQAKLLRPFESAEIEAGNLQASLRSQGHGGSQQRLSQVDSDRRRTLALKALEERLGN